MACRNLIGLDMADNPREVVLGETGPLDTAQRADLAAEIADIERFLNQPAS